MKSREETERSGRGWAPSEAMGGVPGTCALGGTRARFAVLST